MTESSGHGGEFGWGPSRRRCLFPERTLYQRKFPGSNRAPRRVPKESLDGLGPGPEIDHCSLFGTSQAPDIRLCRTACADEETEAERQSVKSWIQILVARLLDAKFLTPVNKQVRPKMQWAEKSREDNTAWSPRNHLSPDCRFFCSLFLGASGHNCCARPHELRLSQCTRLFMNTESYQHVPEN